MCLTFQLAKYSAHQVPNDSRLNVSSGLAHQFLRTNNVIFPEVTPDKVDIRGIKRGCVLLFY